MVIERKVHQYNSKNCGMFFKFDDGQQLYLLWQSGEKPKLYHKDTNSWCIPKLILREVEHRGCKAIGVAWRHTGKVYYYVTNLSDLWNEPSADIFGKVPMRRLNREDFLVQMTRVKGEMVPIVSKAMDIGRMKLA